MPQPPHVPPFNHNILRFNVRCPICSNMYDLQKLRILGERDQQVLAYIDCAVCGTALLSILSMTPSGMTAQGLVTDLTIDEVVDSEEWPAVSMNDVLELHELMESDRPLWNKNH